MYIESIIVCENYSDFLSQTLASVVKFSDYTIVVSSKNDLKTKKLCNYFQVHHLACDNLYPNGNFNKGIAINEALKVLSKKDWCLQIDGDIFIPPNSRNLLEQKGLDSTCLYGVDRQMCRSSLDWLKFITEPELMHEADIFLHPNLFPLGTRVVKGSLNSLFCLGYFQLWNPNVSNVYTYPVASGPQGCRGDMNFNLSWAGSKRNLLGEFIVTHLESEINSKMGVNWSGRKTKPFMSIETLIEEYNARKTEQDNYDPYDDGRKQKDEPNSEFGPEVVNLVGGKKANVVGELWIPLPDEPRIDPWAPANYSSPETIAQDDQEDDSDNPDILPMPDPIPVPVEPAKPWYVPKWYF